MPMFSGTMTPLITHHVVSPYPHISSRAHLLISLIFLIFLTCVPHIHAIHEKEEWFQQHMQSTQELLHQIVQPGFDVC